MTRLGSATLTRTSAGFEQVKCTRESVKKCTHWRIKRWRNNVPAPALILWTQHRKVWATAARPAHSVAADGVTSRNASTNCTLGTPIRTILFKHITCTSLFNFVPKSHHEVWTVSILSPWLRARRISTALWSHSCGHTGPSVGHTETRIVTRMPFPTGGFVSCDQTHDRDSLDGCEGDSYRVEARVHHHYVPEIVPAMLAVILLENSTRHRMKQARHGNTYHRWKSLSSRWGRWNWHLNCCEFVAGRDSAIMIYARRQCRRGWRQAAVRS